MNQTPAFPSNLFNPSFDEVEQDADTAGVILAKDTDFLFKCWRSKWLLLQCGGARLNDLEYTLTTSLGCLPTCWNLGSAVRGLQHGSTTEKHTRLKAGASRKSPPEQLPKRDCWLSNPNGPLFGSLRSALHFAVSEKYILTRFSAFHVQSNYAGDHSVPRLRNLFWRTWSNPHLTVPNHSFNSLWQECRTPSFQTTFEPDHRHRIWQQVAKLGEGTKQAQVIKMCCPYSLMQS